MSDMHDDPARPFEGGAPLETERRTEPGPETGGPEPGPETGGDEPPPETGAVPVPDSSAHPADEAAAAPPLEAPLVEVPVEVPAEPAIGVAPSGYRGWENPLPRVLAVANQKGGVGKTTTTVNMAACVAELGYRVLVVDLDPQANATTGLGLDPRTIEYSMYDVLLREVTLAECTLETEFGTLRVAPSSLDLAGAEIELVPAFNRERKMQAALEPVLADYDYILLDCPPSLGLLTVNALTAASEVMVPIQCEYYALEGLGQLLRNVDLVQRNLNTDLDISTIVLVMYDARTKLAAQVVEEVRAHFGERVCRQVIPRSVRLSEAPSYGVPIIHFDDRSRGALAYRELAKEVTGGAPNRAG